MSARYDAGADVPYGEGWLRLHRNENLFIDSQTCLRLAHQTLDRIAVSCYPDQHAVELREGLAHHYGVAADNVFVGNGSDEVLALLLGHLRHRYDCLHVIDVSYGVYPLLAERMGFQLNRIPACDFETDSSRLPSSGGLFVIDSPNAITGRRVAQRMLFKLAEQKESFLVWDNCYGEFCDDPSLDNPEQPNVAFVRTFSKFYGLAGLRVGYCIAGKDLVAQLISKKDVYNVNAFAQAMATAALGRHAEFAAIAQQVRDGRQRLVQGLLDLGFDVIEPSGNFISVAHRKVSSESIKNELSARKIEVRWFRNTPERLRITVPPPDGLTRLLSELKGILERCSS